MATQGRRGRGRPPLRETLDAEQLAERQAVYRLRSDGATACRELRDTLSYDGVTRDISGLLVRIAGDILGPNPDERIADQIAVRLNRLSVNAELVRGTEQCPPWNGTANPPSSGVPARFKSTEMEIYLECLMRISPTRNHPGWHADRGLKIALWWGYPWGPVGDMSNIQEQSRLLTLPAYYVLLETKIEQRLRNPL